MDNAHDLANTSDELQTRERTQIDFPYSDMGTAEEVTAMLLEKGGGAAEPPQLAAWLNMTAKGGTFRSRVSAARMFGFVTTSRGSIEITALGRRVVDDASAAVARAEAFLNVPLFEAMFKKHNGFALPPAAAIERQMVELGVPKKQNERARRVFQKSADRAQFIDQNSERFIKPSISAPLPRDNAPPPPPPPPGGGSGGDDSGYHPFIQGLLDELPEAGAYANWSTADQAEWLRTAAGIFKLMSKQLGQINVTVENAGPGQKAEAPKVTGEVDGLSKTA